jgi:hypothetical protein
MAMHERKVIELDQGWDFMQKGITKLKNLLEGKPGEAQFNSEDYMMLYTYVPLQLFIFACIENLRGRMLQLFFFPGRCIDLLS